MDFNYEVLQMLWQESLEFVKETEMRSRIIGVSACMKSFDFFFGASLGELLLSHSDNLSKTLQSSTMSAAEGQRIANMTVTTLESLRTDENFELFWKKNVLQTGGLDIRPHFLDRERDLEDMKMMALVLVIFMRMLKIYTDLYS